MNMRKLGYTAFGMALLILVSSAFAQPDSLWSRTFGGADYDGCWSLLPTPDGGYVIAGETSSLTQTPPDIWLVKTNASGDSLWSRIIQANSVDLCNSIQATADGGFALFGTTNSMGSGELDFWPIKTNAAGDCLWTRSFGGSDWEEGLAGLQTSDGGFVIVGYTSSFGVGESDFWMVKTDANGDSLWSRTFGGANRDICWAVQQTSDGGYALAGFTNSFGAGSQDFWLVKTDANGDSLWSRTYGGSGPEILHSAQQTSDGGFILAGRTNSYGAGNSDFWLVKTDASGALVWSNSFGGSNSDMCFRVRQNPDGSYIMGGATLSFGAGSSDFWLVKANTNGDSVWSRTFGGTDWDDCWDVHRTSDGGYVLAGPTDSFGAGSTDYWLVRTGADPAASDEHTTSLPQQHTLHQNWPNPFNPVTQITYNLTRAGHVSIQVFDILGQHVMTLTDEVRSAGRHTVMFDGSNLASGIYLYRLQVGDFATTKKMVLLK